eukprot:1323589-Rhodomonas_salina.2
MVTRIQKDVIAVNLLATVRSTFRSRKGGSQVKTRKSRDPLWHVDQLCFLAAGASACSPLLEKGIRCCRRFLGCNRIGLGLQVASLIRLASLASYAGVAFRIVAYRQLNHRSYGARLRLIASLC